MPYETAGTLAGSTRDFDSSSPGEISLAPHAEERQRSGDRVNTVSRR